MAPASFTFPSASRQNERLTVAKAKTNPDTRTLKLSYCTLTFYEPSMPARRRLHGFTTGVLADILSEPTVTREPGEASEDPQAATALLNAVRNMRVSSRHVLCRHRGTTPHARRRIRKRRRTGVQQTAFRRRGDAQRAVPGAAELREARLAADVVL